MPAARATHADPAVERLWTGATVITAVRTVASLALCLAGLAQDDLAWLVAGLATYWVGDIADGAWARLRDCETRIGATVDILCDRLNCAAFYLCFAALQHEMIPPVAVYLVEFMVVDLFLSLAFLAWPVRSPNYFDQVDRRLWTWNWSKPAKAANSALFAVLLLVTGWWQLGLVIAVGLLVLKCVSVRWLLQLGIPVPGPVVAGRTAALARAEQAVRQRLVAVLVWPAMFLLSVVSALVPFVPFEAAGLALQTRGPTGPVAAVVLGVLAGGGATVGKVVWYEVARRGVESRWAQRKLGKEKVRAGYERWTARVEGRPAYAGAVMLLSSAVGLPPLLVMAAVAGLVRMPMWVFVPTVFVGRTVRFVLLFLGADALLPDFLH